MYTIIRTKIISLLLLFSLISCDKESNKVELSNFYNYTYFETTQAIKNIEEKNQLIDTVWFKFILPDTLKSIRHSYDLEKPTELIEADTCIRRFELRNNEVLIGIFDYQLNYLISYNSHLLFTKWIVKENRENSIIIDAYAQTKLFTKDLTLYKISNQLVQ